MKYRETFIINSFDVDMTKLATPVMLCAVMQETASRQCVDIGISVDDLAKYNQTWMLAKQYIKFSGFPSWRSSIIVETWPRNKTGLRALRDCIIKNEKEEEIAKSVTNWMLIDVNTRRLCKIDETIKHIAITEESVMSEDFKIKVEKFDGEKIITIFKARPSDFDMNAHVTSTCYIKWVLDTVPLEFHKKHYVSELYAEYVEEISSEVDVESIAYMKDNSFYHELKNLQTERIVFRGRTTWQKCVPTTK
ncbi:MAG: thioesterase [Spirochaetaceae bacterium]|nr:thioesterase [Spirochaetaceae bacterium]